MSMHEIESWAEVSLAVVAAADPPPKNACDVAYSIYEWQDMFDCGYTVLRLREELKKIGFLAEFPLSRLPDGMRRCVETLEGGGFPNGDDAYYDADEKILFVTAGSSAWKELADCGLLPQKKVQSVDAGELTLTVLRLAAKRGDELGFHTLGFWYALLPAFIIAAGEVEVPDWAEEARSLCAVPEAFKIGENFRLLPGISEKEIFDEQSSFWYEPYFDYIKKREADPAAAEQEVVRLLSGFEWKKGLELAEKLGEPLSLYYTAFASFYYHSITEKMGIASQKLPKSIAPLSKAEEIFRSLVGKTDRDFLVYSNLAGCCAIEGKYDSAYDYLSDSYRLMAEHAAKLSDESERRFNIAALTPAFYRTLNDMIPKNREETTAKTTKPTQWLLPLDEARRELNELIEQNWEKSWMCRVYLSHCDALEGNYEEALRQLKEADRLNPDDEEIAGFTEEIRAMLENETKNR